MENLTFIQKIKSFVLNHKIWSLIILLVIIISCYFIFRTKTSTETRYVTSAVEKGSIVVSVSGSGQVESSDTIDINAKVSGDIISIPVKVGQEVTKGTLIASVDSRDAKIALENAQISLDKLKTPSTLTVLQKQNSLNKSYNDSWNNISLFIIDMNGIISGLDDLNNGYLGSNNKMLLSQTGKDKINLSEKSYWESKVGLDSVSALYKTLSRSSSNEDIKNLTERVLDTSLKISNTVKLFQTSVDYTSNYLDQSSSSSELSSVQSKLTSWTTSASGYVNSINTNLNSIKENTQSLEDTLVGSDELDIRQAELNLETKQNAYDDSYIRAPFDGIIATLTAKVGQSASGSIGTLITKKKVVSISLNEVDIAKIKLGQKATLTFDAIDGLTITGSVIGIDSVGTVSQGVVTYNVSIGLDVDDNRVKPGMSVSATIITNTAQNIIAVSSSAIKSKNGVSYIEVFNTALAPSINGVQGSTSSVLPKQVEVETGLTSDSSIEIISGLKVGDIIVTKTITSSTSTKTTSTPSILGAVGGNKSGGGNAMRAIEGH